MSAAPHQVLFCDGKGRLIVAISQNSVGNAITELLGIVVKRQVNPEVYAAGEGAVVCWKCGRA